MRAWLTIALCLLTAACAGVEMKPGSKPMARREIPPGPGLLTGSQGEFVLFRLEEPVQDGTPEGKPAQPGDEGEVAQ
ncbi:MAG: hypothetical protein WAU86_05545 [Oricola sp.]